MSSATVADTMWSTAESFINSFNGDWAPTATADQRAEECQHTILPAHLAIPRRTKDEWLTYFKSIHHLIKDAKMTIDDYMPCPDERRATARSSMTATTVVGPYKSEYVWFFTFSESGDKIVEITEFIDSKAASELFAGLRGAGYMPSGHGD